ncbi:MAG: TIGR03936 family radical SAM-associated protein [Candidatus Brocadiales bacterium]|nr:TIGR03936 family radical SAM-associated protein [Candidatus Brocadiales bacterium]
MRFAKLGDIRFISHHDLMKVFERAIRRANIPIAISKGFNPHPKVSILLALSVGIVGKDEVLELELLESIPLESLAERLGRQLPKEINILSVEDIPPSSNNPVSDVTYEIVFEEPDLLKTLKISEFLRQSAIIVNRTKDGRQKPFDIRPSIQEITVKPNSLILSIKMISEGMARPEEVLHALCGKEKKELFEIVRTKVNLFSSA